MNSNLTQLERHREHLSQELSTVQRLLTQASTRGDFRIVSKLTTEATRLNRAISETQDKKLLATL